MIMYLREITEGVISLTQAAENIISMYQGVLHNEKNAELLYRMAENEQVRWLMTQYWEANKNRNGYLMTQAALKAEKCKKALDIMNYWRKMRELSNQTEQNLRNL